MRITERITGIDLGLRRSGVSPKLGVHHNIWGLHWGPLLEETTKLYVLIDYLIGALG